MAAVTPAMIKELREASGAGMMDCKNALVEANGDIVKAGELLREKGLAAAAKKAGRIASEGLVTAYIAGDNSKGVLAEVNSETDFVAKNEAFRGFVGQVAEQALASDSANMDDFFAEKWLTGDFETVKDALNGRIAVIGENLNIRRFDKIEKQESGRLVSYIHGGGKVAVLIYLVSEASGDLLEEAGKNLCMQIAAMNPRFVDRASVPAEFIEKEKEILTQQAINEGKPANIAEKMVQGRLAKNLKEFCLLEQEYVKNGDQTVKQYLEEVGKTLGGNVSVKTFIRYETGEGLAKKEENFAEEVSKAMGN